VQAWIICFGLLISGLSWAAKPIGVFDEIGYGAGSTDRERHIACNADLARKVLAHYPKYKGAVVTGLRPSFLAALDIWMHFKVQDGSKTYSGHMNLHYTDYKDANPPNRQCRLADDFRSSMVFGLYDEQTRSYLLSINKAQADRDQLKALQPHRRVVPARSGQKSGK
jgi:hypothetical protein